MKVYVLIAEGPGKDFRRQVLGVYVTPAAARAAELAVEEEADDVYASVEEFELNGEPEK